MENVLFYSILSNEDPYICSIICCRVWALVITHHPPILHTAQIKVGIFIHFSFMEYAGRRSVASGGNYTLNWHNFIQKQLVTLTFSKRAKYIKLGVFIWIAMTNKTFSFDWSYMSVCKTLVTKDIRLWKAQRNHNFCLWEGTGTAGMVIVYNLRKYVCVCESALLTFFCIWVCVSLSMSMELQYRLVSECGLFVACPLSVRSSKGERLGQKPIQSLKPS